MKKNTLLILAGLLIVIGLVKPDLNNLNLFPSRPNNIDVMVLEAPSDPELKEKADVVANILKDSKSDGKKLRDLYLDLGKLIALDGEDEVIKNTEDIRQANSLAGLMLKLDIKGKYKDLPQAAKNLMVTAIGDDMIVLSKDLREKAVQGFNALAWAANEGSK
jgi:hypothetical protein